MNPMTFGDLVHRLAFAALLSNVGCSGGDDTSGDDTAGATSQNGTTADPTTGLPTSDGPGSSGPDDSTGAEPDDSTGAPATTGAPACGTNVMQSEACDACSHENCCAQVQACFGDESVTDDTACLLLNNCIAEQCAGSTTLDEVEACVDENCPEVADQFDVYLPLNSCQTSMCFDDCAGG
jgi:hypothetical protein